MRGARASASGIRTVSTSGIPAGPRAPARHQAHAVARPGQQGGVAAHDSLDPSDHGRRGVVEEANRERQAGTSPKQSTSRSARRRRRIVNEKYRRASS